jgi:hypothetical protein
MRRRPTILIVILLIMPVVLGGARPAAAEAAQVIDISGCNDPYEYLGDIYQTCFQQQGVVQFITLPSGDTKATTNTTTSVVTTVNGEVSQSDRATLHITELVRDGETQVYHYRSYTLDDILIDPVTGEVVTCVQTYHYVVANGEVRLETNSFECS